MTIIATIILAITSILLIILVLAQKPTGDGLTTLFGGGLQATAASTTHGIDILTKITIVTGLIWVSSVIAIGLLSSSTL